MAAGPNEKPIEWEGCIMKGAKFANRALVVVAALAFMAADKDARRLSYNDGTADSKKSVAGRAEVITFTLPEEGAKVAGIRIHGSRYGTPQPPKENFMIYFLTPDMSETVATKTAPYSRFKRGAEEWVEIKFPKPVEVPKEFRVALDFRAAQTKGVYVSVDSSTDGSHSSLGMPGSEATPANVGGDWMIEAVLAK
jgi:RNA polymerase sigma-70 factor (ECF subfamily)